MISRIGKYEVQAELGQGVFGRVYAAYDPVTKRKVAIKVLLPESDADVLARFSLEVQATVKLKHRNIVTIYDYSQEPPYIVMELVEGESLQQVITRRAPLGLLQKVRILAQTAEGLLSAHRYGIVHGDIKPANIMVTPAGDVKIMDFGIARLSAATESRRTRKGDLVGTIAYMSPERIQGFEAEASADIFSFGIVGFELITGTHPFDGKDYATVIYKITSEDTPSMRRTVPECPEMLDIIVQRATAKDRDARYQSMEELLLDLKPVLLDLERQESASMMRGVQALIDAAKLEEAQEKLREALQLDPMNREARQFRDSLQRDQQRRLVHTKVQKFIEDGSAQLQQRQFQRAIQSFENAVKLDPGTQIGELLGQARAALEANRHASRMLAEAHRELLAGNLDAALRFASQAMEADPNHQEAAALRARLGSQIAERDRQIRVEQSFQAVEKRLSASDFAGARAALAEVDADADPDLLAELRSRIDAEEAEQARRARDERANRGIAKAKQQFRANQLAEAEETLRTVLDEFPEATAAVKLLATVREHAESQRLPEAIGKLTQQVIASLQGQDFAGARRLLEGGLQVYPGEATLQRLLERALDLEKAHYRTEAIGRVLREVQELRAASRIADALALIDRTLAEHGPDTTLTELNGSLEFEREQQIYAEGVREALAHGRKLLDEGKPTEALASLESAAAAYPGEREIGALIAAARQAQAEEEERQRTVEALTRVEQLASRQEWDSALHAADDAVRRYPDNPALRELAARSRASWRDQQRQSHLARRRASVESALATGELARAGHELAALREDFPDEAGLTPLEERLRQARAEAQITALESAFRQCLARDDLAAAEQQLSATQTLAADPRWQTMRGELSARVANRRVVGQARELKDARRYEAAEELLRPIAAAGPPDRDAAALLAEIAAERRREESERAYRQALVEAEQFRRTGDFQRAEQRLQEAVRLALDGRAEELLKTVIEEKGAAERRDRLEQGKRDVRNALEPAPLPPPVLDTVHFTITVPSRLESGGSFELYFWVHLNKERKSVIDRAMLALGVSKPEEIVVKSEGPVPLPRGTVVSARISIEGLTVDPNEKSVVWSGQAGCASFLICLPKRAVQAQYHGMVSIRVNSCEIARMDFVLRTAQNSGRVPAKLKRHASAFASYASEDRDAVLARVQGMQKVAPWLKVFMDAVDIRSGELWENKLFRAIDASDIFYLFWCRHARASKWVQREWRYAYEKRGPEFIDPVPLEPPETAPPPDELKAKHFNDLWTELSAKSHVP